MIGHQKIFYTHIGVEKQVSPDLQLFVFGTMPSPRWSMGMTTNQTIVYLGLVCNRAQRRRVWQHTSLIFNCAWHVVKPWFNGSGRSLDSYQIGLNTTKLEDNGSGNSLNLCPIRLSSQLSLRTLSLVLGLSTVPSSMMLALEALQTRTLLSSAHI